LKLVVQIPVFNEERTVRHAIAEIRTVLSAGPWGSADVITINDGSTDRSMEELRAAGIREIVDLGSHRGLGVAFREGLRRSLELGADVIVNTDADLQYPASAIPELIRPVLAGEADMAIGDRRIPTIASYPRHKLVTQTLGNWLISLLYRARVRDATSGFRAMSRETATMLANHLANPYTYTIESLSLLLGTGKRVAFVPIRVVHDPDRKSRLITSKLRYVADFVRTAFAARKRSRRSISGSRSDWDRSK
jgi:glycosyltransferase involved in cell wall biosynthesis